MKNEKLRAKINFSGSRRRRQQNFEKNKKELPRIQTNISLANYTTFKIGGPAKYFFVAKTKKEIIKAILWAKRKKEPFFILGGGSNLFVSDEGFDGVVIKTQNSKLKTQNHNLKLKTMYTESGARLLDLVKISLEELLTGLEWVAGIPGTIGGAIRGNAGAFGNSMKDIVKEVEVFDLKSEKIKIFKNKDCQFGYRESIFKKNNNLIILSAKLQLEKGKKSEIEKRIKKSFSYRKNTQPLNLPSAGSIFKNQKSKIKNKKLVAEFSQLKEFNKKGIIPAGFLIERCGLKGKKIGRAQVSAKHANFIVNLGGARAEDVIKLMDLIKKEVEKKFKIDLKKEITILS